MIRFDLLENDLPGRVASFRSAAPFEHLVVDGVLDESKAGEMTVAIPAPAEDQQSRDYVFAKNKFEHPRFYEYGPLFAELRDDIVSPRFASFLSRLLGYEVFIDPAFVGGGVHQGGAGSFLDMHADFNRHPSNNAWVRELNVLIYLNRSWREDLGGHLQLQHANTEASASIGTPFNRLVVMLTKGHTLHGYRRISYPPGTYRTSIASYAFSTREVAEQPRSTVWYPTEGGIGKRVLGRLMPTLVAWKSRFFGSATAQKALRK